MAPIAAKLAKLTSGTHYNVGRILAAGNGGD